MNQERFLQIIKKRHEECILTLERKAIIYAPGNGLSNFKDVAAMNNETPQEALWGMVSKHIIATKDMVKSNKTPSGRWITEYMGDIHNYMFLLEAIFEDRRLEEMVIVEGKKEKCEQDRSSDEKDEVNG